MQIKEVNASIKKAWDFIKAGRNTEAIAAMQAVTVRRPDVVEGWLNLGAIEDKINRDSGGLFGGKDAYAKALSLRIIPEVVMDMGNILLRNELRGEEAELFYREAVIRHGLKNGAENLAVCLLNNATLKRTEEAWREAWQWYEWRTMHKLRSHKRLWRGEPLAGKRLFIQFEQGFGDHVFGLRFVKQAKEEGATTVVVTRPNSIRLCMAQPYVDEVFNEEDDYRTEADFVTMLMSMPGYMLAGGLPKTEGKYIDTGHEVRKKGVRVGLCWNGSVDKGYQSWRNVNLEDLRPFMDARPDIEFVSLQKGKHASDAPDIRLERDAIERSLDMWDTACLIESCDLVITTDTMIPHLSASLGVETWVMDRWSSCWQFGVGGPESDPRWYEHLSIIRQPSFGDWKPVIEQITERLKKWTPSSTYRPTEQSFVTRRKTTGSSSSTSIPMQT